MVASGRTSLCGWLEWKVRAMRGVGSEEEQQWREQPSEEQQRGAECGGRGKLALPSPSESKSEKIFAMSYFLWRATDASHVSLSNFQPPSIASSILRRVLGLRPASSSSMLT